jgi:hypothetical protein
MEQMIQDLVRRFEDKLLCESNLVITIKTNPYKGSIDITITRVLKTSIPTDGRI